MEEMVRTWEHIAKFLDVSEKTARAWYHGYGGAKDPCGLRQAVIKMSPRLVVARRSALEACFNRLYPLPQQQTDQTLPQNTATYREGNGSSSEEGLSFEERLERIRRGIG